MRYYTRAGELERELTFERRGELLLAHCGDRTWEIDLSSIGDGSAFSMLVDDASHDVIIEQVDGGLVVQMQGDRVRVEVLDERELAARAVAGAREGGLQMIEAMMPGVVADVLVQVGDHVEAGQTVAVLEAMKMQNPLHADGAGVVTAVHCQKGQAVNGGALLVEIDGG